MFGFRKKLNLTSDEMDDLRRQDIVVNEDKYYAPENIPDKVLQLEECFSRISEVIICPRGSNNLCNTYVTFKNYSCDEVMKMEKLEALKFYFL